MIDHEKTSSQVKHSLGALLARVEKPSRYLGREINAVLKESSEVSVRACLAFPDLYEVGMAHLGTRILYGLGNDLESVQVERVFLPGEDLLVLLQDHELPLFTLESRTPLNRCDLLGFTLQSELTYTNILTILSAAGIPLNAADREENHPVVLAGGPCAFNPEPLAVFLDLVYLGDGEKQWVRMLETLREQAASGAGRSQRIEALKKLPGIYCPADFTPRYGQEGTTEGIEGKGADAVIIPSVLDHLGVPLPASSFLVPFLPPVHDRISIEAARGCTRGCRFCHAGMVYRPTRERGAQSLLDAAEQALDATGYEDLALTSLSIGDYGPLDDVLEAFMDRHGSDRVSVSLPSMRIGGLTPSVARQIQRVRRTGFTIAPEAGTDRLRKVVNKDFTDEEILQTTRWVFDHGWEAVKLYFMIGLPTETEEDLQGIIRLVKAIADGAPARGKVTVNISPFVPKAHTPFQWAAQDPEPVLKEKLHSLQRQLKGGRVQFRWSRTDMALLEAALARGDRRLAGVIESAWREGAVMDGWEEHFNWEIWERAFHSKGLDPSWYASRERGLEEVFPWDHISCGVSKDYLLSEYKRGLAGEVTHDCREAGCHACGACGPEQTSSLPALRAVLGDAQPQLPPGPGAAEVEKPVRRIRVVYSKTGDLRFLGHLEMARMFERACRRAGIPLSFTGGFSPKPRINFALSLPTGIEAMAEWLDLEMAEAWSPERVMESLNRVLPRGIRIEDSWKAPLDAPALNSRVRFMRYRALFPEPVPGIRERTGGIMDLDTLPVVRVKKGKERVLDLKDYLVDLDSPDDRTLHFTLALKGEEGTVRPLEVLRAIFDTDPDGLPDVRLTRTALFFALEPDKAGGRPGWARIWD